MSSADTSLPSEITSVTEGDEDETLSKDVIFELLKNRRRREVLAYLVEAEGTVTLGELAEQIAAWENDTSVHALSSDQRKRVYVALYQTHLPKMDEAGIVEYDQDRGLITLSENADLLMQYLEREQGTDRRWDRLYAIVGISGVAVIGAALMGLPPGTLISTSLLATGVVVAFLLLSLVHAVIERQNRGSSGT